MSLEPTCPHLAQQHSPHVEPRLRPRFVKVMKSSGHLVSPHFEVLQRRLSSRDPLANHHHFTSKKLHHQFSSLTFVTQSAIIAMGIMMVIQFVAVALWPGCTPGTPCKDKKSQLEIFSDIIDQRERTSASYPQRLHHTLSTRFQHASQPALDLDTISIL